jgi:hypothetical protein
MMMMQMQVPFKTVLCGQSADATRTSKRFVMTADADAGTESK